VDWLIKVAVIWLSFDIVLLSTGWYASLIIKQFWPDWWQRLVVNTIDSDVKNF
jgi:hypothetical protein